MDSASSNTYISKRMISLYAAERQKKQEGKLSNLMPVKEFAEGEEVK